MQPISVLRLSAIAASVVLASCGGSDDPAPPAPAPEETRPQDARISRSAVHGHRDHLRCHGGRRLRRGRHEHHQPLGRRAQRRCLPCRGAGHLERQAGDVRPRLCGTGADLDVSTRPSAATWCKTTTPGPRRATARTTTTCGLARDTNALALEFTRIASANARRWRHRTKIFITGHSMAGTFTAAAIEDEAYATARNKVRYSGAVPMCGVMGDTELFDTFGAMQMAALAVAGIPNYPSARWSESRPW